MTWGLTSAQLLQLNRGSDGAVFGIGRTGGSTNPSFKFSIADAGGLTLGGSSGGLTMTNAGNLTVAAPSSGNTLTLNGAASANTLVINGPTTAGNSLVVNAPASGIAAALNGAASAFTLSIQASTTSSASYGVAIHAGTSSGDYGFAVGNAAQSATFFQINGVGSTLLSANSGVVSLVITSANGTTAASDIYVARAGSVANNFAQGPSLQLNDTTNGGQTIFQQSGGQTELWQYNGGWNQIFKVTSARQLTLNLPASGAVLSLATAAGSTTNPPFSFTGNLSTGSASATLTANKPGSNASAANWLSILVAGQQWWIPAWSN